MVSDKKEESAFHTRKGCDFAAVAAGFKESAGATSDGSAQTCWDNERLQYAFHRSYTEVLKGAECEFSANGSVVKDSATSGTAKYHEIWEKSQESLLQLVNSLSKENRFLREHVYGCKNWRVPADSTMYRKRKTCWHFLNDRCRFGEKCWYMHQRKVCKYFLQNRCIFGIYYKRNL